MGQGIIALTYATRVSHVSPLGKMKTDSVRFLFFSGLSINVGAKVHFSKFLGGCVQ